MRCALLIVLLFCSGTPVLAAPKPDAYYPAEEFFNGNHDLRERVIAQTLLIATGNQNAVPTERFTLHIFNAARDFQLANGLLVNGVIDKQTSDRLFAAAKPMFNLWDFREIAHPSRGKSIWMPQGMGLQPTPNRNGLSYKDPQGRIQIAYNFFSNVAIEDAYADLLEKKRRDFTKVHYSVLRDGWFVISATSRLGTDEYLRYHQDREGILGFSAFWSNDQGNVNGERVAVLMSASLGSVMNGRPFVEPPAFKSNMPAQVAEAPVIQPLNRPEPNAVPPLPQPLSPSLSPNAPVPSIKSEDKISTGSGFFIDEKGRFITNAHVIDACKTVVVKTPDGQVRKAVVNATDAANDMALIEVLGAQGHRHASVRYGARLGESIATFGYPHADMLAAGGNFTLGNVTALAGLGDDSRFYQISAPVQRGNSGGAMLDSYGNVIGVVSSKLNVLKVAERSGDFPQNINFAIKGTILASFLESNGVTLTSGTLGGQKLDPADIADAAKAISGFVACQ